MNKDRIASLLAQGLKPSHVATIVGITPARISQLAKDDVEFQNLLALRTSESEEQDIEEKALGAKYHAAEHTLLDQVLAMAPVSELRDVTAALRVVAERQEKMKTRQNPIQSQQAVIQQVIQISIPIHALPEVSLSKEREITSVNERNLAPLSSTAVTNLFAGMRESKENQNEPTRIPFTSETAVNSEANQAQELILAIAEEEHANTF
jgi:hypothetical protein